jgi:hypothetical protein
VCILKVTEHANTSMFCLDTSKCLIKHTEFVRLWYMLLCFVCVCVCALARPQMIVTIITVYSLL